MKNRERKMVIDILELFTPKSNLDVVLEMIVNKKEVKFIGIENDSHDQQSFIVGSWKYGFITRFSYLKFLFNGDNTKCVVKRQNDEDILFMFENPYEVNKIKEAITTKQCQGDINA